MLWSHNYDKVSLLWEINSLWELKSCLWETSLLWCKQASIENNLATMVLFLRTTLEITAAEISVRVQLFPGIV